MDLPDLVRAFNSLPRSPKAPSGLIDNHWQFAIQHVDLNPPGDLLHIVNPGSFYQHTEGPAHILSLPSASAQAEIALPLLLKAFVKSLGSEMPPSAPWTWGTADEEFAKALEERLKAAGVRKELCHIRTKDRKSEAIQQDAWSGLGLTASKLMISGEENATPASGEQDQNVCVKCQKPQTAAAPLQCCGGCKKVQYCSRDCQKGDWKTHKKACKSTTASSSSGPSCNALQYFQHFAQHNSEAKELAGEVGLEFSGPNGLTYGLNYPIRRLVITGNDTPQNITTLLGSNPTDAAMVKDTHKEARIEALLQPPRGSPMYAIAAMGKLDSNSPPWTPREASPAEAEELRQIRAMQDHIRRYMGARSVRSINSQDMSQILIQNFGNSWDEALPIYQTAINAMDQGVQC